MTYELCLALINNYKKRNQTKKLEEFKNKLDVYYAANRLTEEQYNYLVGVIDD